MSVLLTGATGFVGKHLWNYLVRAGYSVDILFRGARFPNKKYDLVINCAGEINNKNLMYESNYLYVQELLKWCGFQSIDKVIQIGSSSEYGATKDLRCEDARCEPADYYGWTKYLATTYCEFWAFDSGTDVIIARPFSLYGPNDTPRKLIPKLFKSIENGAKMKVGAGEHDWIYINDFCEGILKVISRMVDMPQRGADIVNFGTGTSLSNAEVVETLEDMFETKFPQIEIQEDIVLDHTLFCNFWEADTDKAEDHYGWTATIDLREGLTRIYQNLKDSSWA